MERVELSFPYDFDRVLDRLSLDPLHAVDKERKEVRVPLPGYKVATVQGKGSMESPVFEINGIDSPEEFQHIQEIFHFNRSLEPINDHFQQTNLAEIFKEHRGTPIVREFNLYGSLAKSIIHQQLNLKFAHTLTTRFVHSFGHQVDGVWFYPEPERVAELTPETLREMQFSTRKAEYVIGLSKAVAEGELDLHSLSLLDDDEVIRTLTHYRGVGPWTAQNFLLFGLGRPNLFPIADIGLQNALKKLWRLDDKPKAEDMAAHFPQWTPFMSYASLYLWRSIE
ncbi:DNA-3-methyladenine glycosylase family protein [Chungangia koreensis]|uniref:DNA-3-methyladenine glycosylase II n=1 Tax=Chungangia koreensis TaxID=752657 RepID=A0ABV8X227_9LACT